MKDPNNSRAAFKVGVTYNSILDDQGNSHSDEDNEYMSSFLTRASAVDSMSSNETQISSHIFDDMSNNTNPSEIVPKRKKRRISKKKSSKDALIHTTVLPDSFRSIFGFDKFNRMQSEAFPTLYGTSDNCVISSPTGSGKTVLFELAILRLLKESKEMIGNTKILYIAPTKSLCCERFKDWGPTFLNLTVGMLTSDTSFLETEKVKKCNIIITTPEKWDLLTRKWNDYSRLFELVKLLLVDEIHTLRERRGATLEVVITRMNLLCESLRIIAVSATIPNIEDISQWLKPKKQDEAARVLFFDDSYRQVDLERWVYGYSFLNKNEFQYDNLYNLKLDEVFRKHSKQRPVLIFCPTRASTISTANYIVQNCLGLLNCQKVNQNCRIIDNALSDCYRHGVAFHHAGLSIDDRNVVEEAFLSGTVKVLCSTSTLAVGVNLPAYLVIIKGTRIWNCSVTQEYSQLDILQMIGRAGRPQFESEGCAIIMTDAKMKRTYEKLLYGTDDLESSLHLELMEHLAAEISLGTIYSTESAVKWLRNTFFYIRFLKNPTRYHEVSKYMKNRGEQDSQLLQFSNNLLEILNKHQIIQQQDNNFVSTPFGHAMTRHYVLFESMKLFIQTKKAQTTKGIMSLLTSAKEFSGIRMRHKEKKLYKEINLSPLLKYPFLTEQGQSKIIDATSQKVSLLIQYELGGLEFPSYSGAYVLHQTLVQDKLLVFRHCFRILKCMVDAFVERKDGISLKNTLFVLRSVNGSCWEDSPMVLRQMKSIGLVSVRKLVHHGILTLQQFSQLSEQQIEYYLGLKIGNGAKIQKDLNLLPRLRLRCKLESCSTNKGELIANFKVEISAEFKSVVWHGQSLSLDVETSRTTGELLDFRRISLAHLKSPRSFRISTSITSKVDNIEFMVNCLEIAGLGETNLFLTKDLPPQYIKLVPTGSKHSTLENCLSHPESDEDGKENSFSSDDSLFLYLASEKDGNTETTTDAANSCTRKVRSNGNFECYHPCREKARCRHLCCKEGIPKNCLRNKKDLLKKKEGHDRLQHVEMQNAMDKNNLKSLMGSLSKPKDLPTPCLINIQPAAVGILSNSNQTFIESLMAEPAERSVQYCNNDIPHGEQPGLSISTLPSSQSSSASNAEGNESQHCQLEFLGSDVDLS